jgi:ribosomal-protein-alanine N-acetyltransferase
MATPAIGERVQLKQGTSDDLDGVMEVMEAAFGDRFGEAWTRSQLAGILPMAGVRLTIARTEDQRAVGFSLTRTAADEAELLLIAVLPERHRSGIGYALLDEFLAHSRNEGLSRVHLEVRDGNPALNMYSVAGFSAVGRRHNYYHATDGERYDAITLSHNL